MIVERKNTGTPETPVWEPDIPSDLNDKISSATLRGDGRYDLTLTEVEKVRNEMNTKIDEIADLIEGGARGQELANLIRNL